jgi:Xaa-Pro aminopeptidase
MKWLNVARHNFHFKSRLEPQSVLQVPSILIDILPLISEARLFKCPVEIEYMRRAAQISALAHKRLMEQCRPGQMEYQLEAWFNAYCLENGCRGLAYNSIVASGNNSCTLHYVANDQAIKNNDLILVDAGGEYNYYAADITRTYPANGKFTKEQRQIYELVLRAQLAGIDQVKPGNRWNSVQDTMVKIITTGLLELGILKGDLQQLLTTKAHRQFYMHSSGHWLGMDVHDVGDYKVDGNWRTFEPGMVLTVEPGIYIHNSTKNIDSKWLGIGIRIEDDLLVTSNGNEVLSSLAPKQIAEIERG